MSRVRLWPPESTRPRTVSRGPGHRLRARTAWPSRGLFCGPEDFESAAAFHDLRRSERVGHPLPQGIGSLARARDKPEPPSPEQVGRCFRDDPIHDLAAGANRRIAEDMIEGQTGHGLVESA